MTETITTPTRTARKGGDQARGLRALASVRHFRCQDGDSPVGRCHTVVVAGGKGGVGRSIIALNLAVLFAQRGERVGLFDAAAGLGHLELLSGLNGYWNLSHVAHGCREVIDVVQTGPSGVSLVSGANCLNEISTAGQRPRTGMIEQLCEFERNLDWMILDASGGVSSVSRQVLATADDVLVVTTPEATAIAEAYATIKSLATFVRPRVGVLVNQAESAEQANQILDRLQHVSKSFLQIEVQRRGFIPRDSAIPQSVNDRVPVVIQSPQSEAAVELSKLAGRWTRTRSHDQSSGFFARLFQFCSESHSSPYPSLERN